MLSVEDWAEIRRLHVAQGMAIKQIFERLGVARNTVRAAVRDTAPPKYQRAAVASRVDPVEAQVRELLKDLSDDAGHGDRGEDRLAVRLDGPEGAGPKDPAVLPAGRSVVADGRSSGELPQWDFWFPDIALGVGWGQQRSAKQLPVLTLTTGYARWLGAVLIPSRAAEDRSRGCGSCWGRSRSCWSGTVRARSAVAAVRGSN